MKNNVILLVRQLNHSLEQCGREQMKRLDISPSQGLALHYLLSRTGHTVYATELHEKLGISKSAISSILKALKKKGFLDMASAVKDDRRKQIILTEKAFETEKQIEQSLAEQHNRLCRNIPKQNLEISETVLLSMISNIKQKP